MPDDPVPSQPSKAFGGRWSDVKLDALARYLGAYSNVLKNQPFEVCYIDAFAGAGDVEIGGEDQSQETPLLFDSTEQEAAYRHGSPLIALENRPPFHSFTFIDRDRESLESLRNKIEERGQSGRRIEYLHGDANAHLQRICSGDLSNKRAVAFLDPFAMQLKWETLEALANTKVIDMWLLFPAMAVSRMLPRSGHVPETWENKLNETFGCNSWKEVFYSNDGEDLFGDQAITKLDGFYPKLSDFITGRMKTIFPGVTRKPLVLRNRSGSPLFLLCFACANPNKKAIDAALRIAEHIIGKK